MDFFMEKKKKNLIYFKQAAISQMEKELNQRRQDVQERDKEVCTREWLAVTTIFCFFLC